MSAPAIVSSAPALAGGVAALMDGCAGLWRADEMGREQDAVRPTGLPGLDAVLPGGGWPVGALVEVLQVHPQQQVWRLLAPALASAVQQEDGPVVLVGPPHPAFVPGLAARGLPASRLLWVQADTPAARLWAAEQALRCAEVAAVLAWLPAAGVQAADLRRLHLAAQRHGRLLFALRPQSVARQASPARLRLRLHPGEDLVVDILKRRGPPLVAPVRLPAHHELLAQWLQSRPSAIVLPEPSHGLDRAAAFA